MCARRAHCTSRASRYSACQKVCVNSPLYGVRLSMLKLPSAQTSAASDGGYVVSRHNWSVHTTPPSGLSRHVHFRYRMMDPLPPPGTQPFLPSLLSHVRSAVPGFPLEPVIVQVLLLCIIAGDKNLILRTRDEDITLLSKLVTLVGSRPPFISSDTPSRTIHTVLCPREDALTFPFLGPEYNIWLQRSQAQVPF